jgi:hypothetical protein
VSWPVQVPIDVGRQEGADAARRELSKAIYGDARPSIPQQFLNWVVRTISDAINALVGAAPGGIASVLALVAVIVVVVIVVTRRVGRLRRSETADVPVFVGRLRSAADYRAAADAAAAEGNWDEAVRQRFRAIVRSLEERDVLDPRPGRTADEAAAEAARAMPTCAQGLRAAATSFDDVAYGNRPRDLRSDSDLRELDRQLQSSRPIHDLAASPR